MYDANRHVTYCRRINKNFDINYAMVSITEYSNTINSHCGSRLTTLVSNNSSVCIKQNST